MKQNKVEEVQQYLASRSIVVSETAIVNAAIDIVKHDLGLHTFYSVLKDTRKQHKNPHDHTPYINLPKGYGAHTQSLNGEWEPTILNIKEIAVNNPYIYKSLKLWESSSISERGFLIRLVLLLNEVYTDLLITCRKYHGIKKYPDAISVEEIK